MAGRGYVVPIASETKAFRQGVQTGIIEPTKDAVRELGKLGDSRGPEQLEQGMKDAQTATGKVKREVEDTADTIAREYRDAYRKAKQSSEDATGSMGENVDEFKNEAKSNFAEVAASFKGDMEDMADGVQGLTGGLAASLTPGIGIPVAIIGAIAATFLADWLETTEKTKESVSEMYQAMTAAGTSYLTSELISQKIKDLAADEDTWNDAKEAGLSLNLSAQTVLRAMAGDARALADVQTAEDERHRGAMAGINAATEDGAALLQKENDLHSKNVSLIGDARDVTEQSSEKAAIVNSALGTTNTLLDEQVRKVQDIAAGLDGIANTTINVRVNPDLSELKRQLGQPYNITVNARGQITQLQMKGGKQLW